MGIEGCIKCGDSESELNSHHIIPRSEGGGDEDDNLVVLCVRYHREWHQLMENWGWGNRFLEWVCVPPLDSLFGFCISFVLGPLLEDDDKFTVRELRDGMWSAHELLTGKRR